MQVASLQAIAQIFRDSDVQLDEDMPTPSPPRKLLNLLENLLVAVEYVSLRSCGKQINATADHDHV